MTNPVEVKNLLKVFNGNVVVSNVSLSIEPGTVYGLLGRNGSGKTTLLRLLLGILSTSKGQAKVFGESFAQADSDLRQRVAYVGQEYRFYNSYTLAELVNIIAPMYKKWDCDKADRLLVAFPEWALDKIS